jgi:hypothetical protein
MLHRIEMDAINMAVQITVIPNGMFPISALPNQSTPVFSLRKGRDAVSELHRM